jgi:hypothetical protein
LFACLFFLTIYTLPIKPAHRYTQQLEEEEQTAYLLGTKAPDVSKKGKKKGSAAGLGPVPMGGGAGYLPSLGGGAATSNSSAGNPMLAAERRIEELNKLASTTAALKSFAAQQQQQVPFSLNSSGRLPLGSAAAAAAAGMTRSGSQFSAGGGGGYTAPSTGAAAIPGGANAGAGVGSYRPSMSGSEADFLSRQIQSAAATADIGQLSMFSTMEDLDAAAAAVGLDGKWGRAAAGMVGVPPPNGLALGGDSIWSTDGYGGGGGVGGGSSVLHAVGAGGSLVGGGGMGGAAAAAGAGAGGSIAEMMTGAFKDKVSSLEREIQALTSKIERKEGELEMKDSRLKKLQADLDTMRRETQLETKKLITDVSTYITVVFTEICACFVY